MDKPDITLSELEQLAQRMVDAMAQLECPDCCGPVYQFIETGALIYQEEMEWAWVATSLRARIVLPPAKDAKSEDDS